MEIRHPTHPDQLRGSSTEELRARYLIEDLFSPTEVRTVYTHQDRVVIGGVAPIRDADISLPTYDPLRSATFCERRELGIINIGATGTVNVDGDAYRLDNKDCLYVGRGAIDIVFGSDSDTPAAFYLISTPAHTTYPTALARFAETAGTELGAPEGANVRTLRRYIHLDGIRSCQLVMGITVLASGSTWNTMPCHTHDRRTEIYLYTDLPAEHRIVHLMGRPDETHSMIVADRQAVIAPSWSVHCGCGTHNYAFVWAMAGENQAFDDMDQVAISELR